MKQEYYSLLSDEEVAEIEAEEREQSTKSFEAYCRRVGISVQMGLEMAAAHASRVHGRPMMIEAFMANGKLVGYRVLPIN